MLRNFVEHAVRPVDSLDGLWDFVVEKDRRDRGKLPRRYDRAIYVPSAWEMLPGLENYRGTGWLRTWFQGGQEDQAVRLVFGGVSHTGTVYVDGRKRGRHYDAFTPWDVVIPSVDDGEHELVVEVDNTFGDHSALHQERDYYTYGGITRPVEIQLVPAVYIGRILATPRRRGKKWELDIRVHVRNWSTWSVKGRVVLSVGGSDDRADLGAVTVRGRSERELSCTLTGLEPEIWSEESPALYYLEVLLLDQQGQVVDDRIDRIGFREIKVRGRKLLLNGQSIRLRGYSRHEDHPQFGNALPPAAMMTDLQIMRDQACNFVRTSHYPNDMRFLDLCDELGFYVWEEPHGKGFDFRHPKYKEQMTTSAVEMLAWHHNHPSIIMWGFLNECESSTARGRKEHTRMARLIKTTDPSRPTVFASNQADRDLCAGIPDIVAWNRYDAWYNEGIETTEPKLKAMFRWLDSPKSGGGRGKPVILSEFGAGAFYGCRKANHPKWSEEYQAETLDEALRVFLNHPGVVGTAIWQFSDVRATQGLWNVRPREYNNKGIVDEYRRAKLAYDVVKKRHLEAKRKYE